MSEVHSVYDLQLERDVFISLVSGRGSGKTVLASNLIHYYLTAPEDKRCHFAYLFSSTAKINRQTNSSYSFFDDRAIMEPTPEVLNPFIYNLKLSQIKTKNKYHVLLVLDDIDVSLKLKSVEWLATKGRHYSVTVVILSQITNCALSPKIRANNDYVIWRKVGIDALRTDIFKYMSVAEFTKFKQLLEYTLANFSDYKFIMYDNKKDSDKIKNVRAQELPQDFKYKLASPTPKRARRKNLIKW